MRLAPLAAAVLLAGACAHAPSGRTVVVEGWAGGAGEGARTRAVWDALRRAVEAAGSVRVEARSRVDRGAGVDSRVVARSGGCVLEYAVLEEGETDGGVRVRARAAVSADEGSCARHGALPPPYLEDATVSVALIGRGPGDEEAARAAASELRRALAGRGVPVLASGGEYRVTGEVRAEEEADPRLRPYIGAWVEVAMRVTHARDGRVMRDARRDAVAYEADLASAEGAAAAEAAAETAAEVLAALDEGFWRPRPLAAR